jgi:hypothetical protein
LSADEAAQLLARMDCRAGGELLALNGGRVTSREIRQLEWHVIDVAVRAAGKEDPSAAVDQREREAGLAAAEASLGHGKHLDREQLAAFELLTSGSGWVCLTGRAGTGKGPTLHAAAEAYRNSGWRVIGCAMDGTTARRIADQLGGAAPALTVEQLRVRLQAGAIDIDDRTVMFVDEATKLDTGQWAEISNVVERHGATVRAVGHNGQHDAIRLPGLFSEMLGDKRIPRAELQTIRRHRNPEHPGEVHPWLGDYQVAVDEGRGTDAVAILQEQHAFTLYDTRARAMAGMVDEWDEWRRRYEPAGSALIVHGSNSDVDLVNELAQQKRLKAGELGEQSIRAVDRDYLLRPGDLVAIRNAAYTLPPQPGQPRPKRIENGQVATIQAVKPERDMLTLLVREPGSEPRLVEIDQARLRSEHAARKRAAAVRLNYALHSFPAQGATVHGTATLAGHWSQAKQETYVGDTRAIYRHTVHIARGDLGTDGTDEDRISRYAQRISANRQRHASIRSASDPTLQIAIGLPDHQPLPSRAAPAAAPRRTDTSLRPSTPTPDATTSGALRAAGGDTSPGTDAAAGDSRLQQHARLEQQFLRLVDDPPRHLLLALSPAPANRVARERCEREARRLEGLQAQTNSNPEAPAHPLPHGGQSAIRQGPSTPPPVSQRPAGLAIGR